MSLEARKQDLLRRLGLAHGTIRKRTSSVLIRATDTFSKNAQKHKAALLLKSLIPIAKLTQKYLLLNGFKAFKTVHVHQKIDDNTSFSDFMESMGAFQKELNAMLVAAAPIIRSKETDNQYLNSFSTKSDTSTLSPNQNSGIIDNASEKGYEDSMLFHEISNYNLNEETTSSYRDDIDSMWDEEVSRVLPPPTPSSPPPSFLPKLPSPPHLGAGEILMCKDDDDDDDAEKEENNNITVCFIGAACRYD